MSDAVLITLIICLTLVFISSRTEKPKAPKEEDKDE